MTISSSPNHHGFQRRAQLVPKSNTLTRYTDERRQLARTPGAIGRPQIFNQPTLIPRRTDEAEEEYQNSVKSVVEPEDLRKRPHAAACPELDCGRHQPAPAHWFVSGSRRDLMM